MDTCREPPEGLLRRHRGSGASARARHEKVMPNLLGAKSKAEVAMGRAQSSEDRLSLGGGNGGGTKRGGHTISGESLGAAGGNRPRTVDCGAPYKRPMSSSGS
ncbi:jg18058 [Pararge aegeria aegeria]|uniref:Jg18058 protein n=1 Tax=Pararge aegeria aegeria TaxID=348720 RepID=A0A8S4RG64_9NEOP|nr:jg18058 [Pararge aegeria aegeria]